ncbi:MAG: biotin synthase BioB, partial [Deltaproteobacteria bacterium]|nr:biotin synthase BioB [Deltaproteobacteria bacterium]
MNRSVEALAARIIAGEQLSEQEAISLSASSGTDTFALFLA